MIPIPIDKEKVDALREAINQLPEGSPSRQLLAMVDEGLQEFAEDRKRTVLHILQQQLWTEEEAQRIAVAWEAGAPVETERVRCWSCGGWGDIPHPSGSITCETCHGQGKAFRFKMPESCK